MMKWIVYVIECVDKSFYTGITNNLEKRLLAHHSGKGAKYTRGRGPFKVVLHERYLHRGSALRRERQIKALTRREKLCLIKMKI